MKRALCVGLTVLTYCTVAYLTADDIIKPLLLVTSWSWRLGVPDWQNSVIGSAVIAAMVFAVPIPRSVGALVKWPTFMAVWMLLSLAWVGYHADGLRQEKLAEFHPDKSIEHSFFQSVRYAPADFQFFLHTAALKDCIPYGWSYRRMKFYRIPASVAVNVLDPEWRRLCGIDLPRR